LFSFNHKAMLGKLNEDQQEELLKTQLLGRIGCSADGITYIVPVNYLYKSPYIYAHSASGMKISLMRKNPEVCFEVDKVENYFNWQSVICWGTFEEITDMHGMEDAMQLLINRIEPFMSQMDDAHPSHGFANRESDIGTEKELILYRIKLNNKTGRFEQRELSPTCKQEL
jgi:nitroimidazol reductase NimA-like FMN-containing flavoprotein (pyridoxamine 5'-phosphate oxidase superfamily)